MIFLEILLFTLELPVTLIAVFICVLMMVMVVVTIPVNCVMSYLRVSTLIPTSNHFRVVFNWASKVITRLLWFCFTSLCVRHLLLDPSSIIFPLYCSCYVGFSSPFDFSRRSSLAVTTLSLKEVDLWQVLPVTCICFEFWRAFLKLPKGFRIRKTILHTQSSLTKIQFLINLEAKTLKFNRQSLEKVKKIPLWPARSSETL